MLVFRRSQTVVRPRMPADVVIVGGGPAGLACALRLAQLIDASSMKSTACSLSKDSIFVIEKGAALGQHVLSGAVLDPRSLRELMPEFEGEAPLDSQVTREEVCFLTSSRSYRLPVIPPPLRDHGCYIVSLNRLVQWMGEKVEAAGIPVLTGFAGAELLRDGDRVIGVRTDDKGIDRRNSRRSNFEPGNDIEAKVVVLAEGSRGSLTRQLALHPAATSASEPEAYGQGVKEIWKLPLGRLSAGSVIYTMGYPLTSSEYGGAFVYANSDRLASVGCVVSLDYRDPRIDPQRVLQEFKRHPMIAKLLDGGQLVRYAAKTLPYGGWWSMPPLAGAGWLILGDSAGLLNSQRLKGIHLAVKSGMLAAEAIFDAMAAGDTTAQSLQRYARKVESSWIRDELWPVRNFHQAFEHGLWPGLARAALQYVTRGRDLGRQRTPGVALPRLMPLSALPRDGGTRRHLIGSHEGDGTLTFDKTTDLYHSGTTHEEDQPSHIVISDPSVCVTRCTKEYGNPCLHFCPANVFELTDSSTSPGQREIHLHSSNCLHCKTCDIMDPFGLITWVPPEGGGGPNYEGM